MASFTTKPVRGGVELIVTSDDMTATVGTELDQREVELVVRQICRDAGLPEPWKKG